MATVTYRALSPTGDPMRGQGAANFLSDKAAVAQMLSTQFKLLQGEWWQDLSIGVPMFQSILDHANTTEGVALILRGVTMQNAYVTDILNLVVTYGRAGRTYSFSEDVQTVFGTIQLNSQPLPGNQASLT